MKGCSRQTNGLCSYATHRFARRKRHWLRISRRHMALRSFFPGPNLTHVIVPGQTPNREGSMKSTNFSGGSPVPAMSRATSSSVTGIHNLQHVPHPLQRKRKSSSPCILSFRAAFFFFFVFMMSLRGSRSQSGHANAETTTLVRHGCPTVSARVRTHRRRHGPRLRVPKQCICVKGRIAEGPDVTEITAGRNIGRTYLKRET